ncbi:MAG TPA: hypothetical protein VFU73_04715 [Actinocrinis sp.]|nr:hypothetical protein [Actinocrinis sp.]
MSILRDEFHQTVDRLPENELAAILAVVRGLGSVSDGPQRWPSPSSDGMADNGDAPQMAHRLSFTSTGSGPTNLAERAEDYLRASGFGHPVE